MLWVILHIRFKIEIEQYGIGDTKYNIKCTKLLLKTWLELDSLQQQQQKIGRREAPSPLSEAFKSFIVSYGRANDKVVRGCLHVVVVASCI